MKKIIYLLFSILSFNNIIAQSIAPFVINNGGGYSTNLEWSMNESVSIANFNSGNYFLNTGVLQPTGNILKNNVDDDNASMRSVINIWPNPTSNLLNVKLKYLEIGNLSFQLIDLKGGILLTEDAGTIYTTYEKSFAIESLPSAPYFLKIFFKPLNQISKVVVYKIIKL